LGRCPLGKRRPLRLSGWSSRSRAEGGRDPGTVSIRRRGRRRDSSWRIGSGHRRSCDANYSRLDSRVTRRPGCRRCRRNSRGWRSNRSRGWRGNRRRSRSRSNRRRSRSNRRRSWSDRRRGRGRGAFVAGEPFGKCLVEIGDLSGRDGLGGKQELDRLPAGRQLQQCRVTSVGEHDLLPAVGGVQTGPGQQALARGISGLEGDPGRREQQGDPRLGPSAGGSCESHPGQSHALRRQLGDSDGHVLLLHGREPPTASFIGLHQFFEFLDVGVVLMGVTLLA
jgi:hypothetical protein